MPTAFPFRAVIFDMDGVIVDTEAAYIVEQRVFLDEHGIDVPTEELNAMVGTSHETFVNALVDWCTPTRPTPASRSGAAVTSTTTATCSTPVSSTPSTSWAVAACASRSPRRRAWTTSSTCSASEASPTASR